MLAVAVAVAAVGEGVRRLAPQPDVCAGFRYQAGAARTPSASSARGIFCLFLWGSVVVCGEEAVGARLAGALPRAGGRGIAYRVH